MFCVVSKEQSVGESLPKDIPIHLPSTNDFFSYASVLPSVVVGILSLVIILIIGGSAMDSPYSSSRSRNSSQCLRNSESMVNAVSQ